jgi:hypothetical protein
MDQNKNTEPYLDLYMPVSLIQHPRSLGPNGGRLHAPGSDGSNSGGGQATIRRVAPVGQRAAPIERRPAPLRFAGSAHALDDRPGEELPTRRARRGAGGRRREDGRPGTNVKSWSSSRRLTIPEVATSCSLLPHGDVTSADGSTAATVTTALIGRTTMDPARSYFLPTRWTVQAVSCRA